MSKRFGRNQKRALKKEVQNWKHANEKNCSLAAHSYANCQRLQSQLDHITKVLGVNHIALPVKDSNYKITDPNFMGSYFVENKKFSDFYAEHLSPTFEFSRQEMYVLTTRVAETADKSAIHMRVRLANEEIAYSISREAIYMIPEKLLSQVLTQHIVSSISESLAKVLKNG